MTKGKKRAGAAQHSVEKSTGKDKRVKTTGTEKKPQPRVVMSLQCIQCNGNITDSAAGSKLSFFEDGNSLHLVMTIADEARVRTGFKIRSVAEDKMPNEKNPYASVSHVLCNNRKGGRTCNKKVGAIKCCPPFSDNQLIFFQHKALLSNGYRISSWMSARETGLREVQVMPPRKEDEQRQFKPQERPPLVRSISHATKGEEASALGEGLTTTRPRSYQTEVFQSAVMSERNSLIYLPSGFGETVVAAMVAKKLVDLNTERQAFFLVHSDAEAIRQAGELQYEMRCMVEVMMGSSLGFGAWDECGGGESGRANNLCEDKLLDLRAARLVVATADAFEHALCKRYIDPDSICCVVLMLEEMDFESPVRRLAKAFFLPRKGRTNAPASSKPASQLPKLVVLMATPIEDDRKEAETVSRLEELQETFAVDLVAPVRTIQEVKDDAGRVDFEVVNVASTPEETLLLQSLEKLVLRRIMKVAPKSDPASQAQILLRSTVNPTEVSDVTTRGSDGGRETVRSIRESYSEFPSQDYAVLCQQALMVQARNGMGTIRTVESGGGGKGGGGDEGKSSGDNDEVLDEHHIIELMNLTFAVDETGNEVAWRKLLRLLEEMWESTEEEIEEGELCYDPGKSVIGNAPGKEAGLAETDDLDRDDVIHIIRSYLFPSDVGSDEDDEAFDKTSEPEAGAGGTGSRGVPGGEAVGMLGSKLDRIVKLLEEHKKWCDRSGYEFFALVFVSTRELSMTTPDILASIPTLKPFLRARSVLKTLEGAMAIDEGQANVIVSTPMCGVGLKVPDRGLVVCASGSSAMGLRGGLLYGENCRLVGLSRDWGEANLERVRTLINRENTMWAGIETFSAGNAADKGACTTTEGQGSDGDGGGGIGVTPVKIPHSAQAGQTTQSSAGSSPRVDEAAAAAREVLKPPPPLAATMIVPDKTPSEACNGSTNGNGNGKEAAGRRVVGAAVGSSNGASVTAGVDVDVDVGAAPVDSREHAKGWKKTLPDLPSPAARKYAATYLATCLKQTLQRKPDDMARCSINTTAQLAHAIKPVFEYDERRLPGNAHETVFESRCFVWSKVDELKGLIASKEAKGTSIKSSREAAAQKMVQYLLLKDEHVKAESLPPSSNDSAPPT